MRCVLVVCVLVCLTACRPKIPVDESVAQLERVRAGVAVAPARGASEGVTGVRRISTGDAVRTDATGRAILALDGGGRYILDHDSVIRVRGARAAALEAGRIWVAGGGEGGRQEDTVLTVGDATLHLRGTRASVQRRDQTTIVSVLAGEIAFESGSRRGAVRAGESAEIQGARTTVAAQRFFQDWTGGLADDLPTISGDSSGVGAVAARRPDEVGAPRWPMVMQRLDAHVVVRGDLAITTLDQTFFNPSADTVEGIYSFKTPAGAVLQMFGVDRHGRTVEGVVQERAHAAQHYQEQVYQGSTHDPALLEWDAPGRYHARLYPIPPGATRRIRVRYTQWMSADPSGRRAYRLPLASLDSRIGELRADFDLEHSNAIAVRAGSGARMEDQHLFIAQSDVIPRADLVVELQGATPGDIAATRVPARGDPRGGYVRVAVRAPVEAARDPHDEGVDLVIVVDHSAATDDLGLRLEQAFVESVVNALDPRDQVLVLAGDVGTRALGAPSPELRPATPENRRAIIEALASDRLGGATDLGAMIAAAHRALRPDHNGAVVYVGDGNATVGEAQLPALRQLMARLSPRPRFYAIAVGEDPKLDLLSGLAEPAGFAARVARRGEIARTALDLVEHASRPLVRNFHVDLGPEIQNVYPTEAVDLPAGESLVVVGRYQSTLPKDLNVRATWNGAETTRRVQFYATDVDDEQDLKYRWGTMRLQNLLARGESRPVIVELGTRYHLITPYTSLYVPSEDEVSALDEEQRQRHALEMRTAEFSAWDLLPLVGCSRSERSPPPTSVAAAASAQAADQEEGGSGTRHAGAEGRMGARGPANRSARYAVRNGQEPPHLSRQAAREAVASRGIFAAMGAPGGGAPAEPAAQAAPTPAPVVSPFGAVTESGEDRRAADEVGDAFGYGGLGATGAGGGGGGEGTIGLGSIGTMGHGSGTGSGQGYGSGAGRGLRGGNSGPLVRAAPPQVSGMLSPESIRRVVLRNLGQVAHCHEQGLAQNPNAAGRVAVRFVIGGNGAVMGSNVASSNVPVPSVATCIANAVRRWQFPSPEGGGIVTVNYPFTLNAMEAAPPQRVRATASARETPAARATAPAPAPSLNTATADPDARAVIRCSDAAAVTLAERIPLWRERLSENAAPDHVAGVYRSARRACELPAWSDRVALLQLMAGRLDLEGKIALYHGLGFDNAARNWTRNVVLRALARAGNLARAQELGLGRIDAEMVAGALGRASTPQDRLNVLRELTRRYPDDTELALRVLDLAVELHSVDDVRTIAGRLRFHPQADARIRTATGEALLSVGDEAEARRAFSEIVEFAPDDPMARRRLGDIALSHNWADEAYRQFQMLSQLENDAPEVLVRQAMAARMAGRLDEAIRLAERVAEQASAGSRGGISDQAATWIGVELALAAGAEGIAPEMLDALRARWRRSPAARASGAVRAVLRWYHPDDGAELWVSLPGETQRRSDMIAESVFLESTVLADAVPSLSLEVRKGSGSRPRGQAELIVIWNEGTPAERATHMNLVFDNQHQHYVITATPTALSDVTPPQAPAAPEAAVTPGARASTQSFARGAL